MKKFDFLFRKQKNEINALNSKNKQKIKNKKSYQRYKNRKKLKKLNLDKSNLEQANSIIINKSTFNLNNNHKILLMHGLNFAPTPK